jgi:hypothetical protein
MAGIALLEQQERLRCCNPVTKRPVITGNFAVLALLEPSFWTTRFSFPLVLIVDFVLRGEWREPVSEMPNS